VLLAALGLELSDLLLHGSQRLLHRSQRLQHLAFRTLALGALDLLEPGAIGEILELQLLVGDLLTQGGCRCLKRGDVGAQFGALGGLIRSYLGKRRGVLSFEHGRVLAGAGGGPTSPPDKQADDGAENDADDESDDQGNDGIHGAKYRAIRGHRSVP